MPIFPAFRKLKGRYEFQSVLSQGGMGVIYRAYDMRVKRPVAVKTIRDVPDRAALELFERECEILARLSHPNVVEIFDVGEFEEAGSRKPYFVMPLLSGRTLDEIICESQKPMPISRGIEILSQVCRGLQAAHEQGLVHRDLKPSNIFVLEDDSVKIIDFGVAKMLSSVATIGRKGTPFYMAPEQIKMAQVTPKSDQFALGVVAYQIVTGRRPFEGSTDHEVARAILRLVPAPAGNLNPEICSLVSQVIAKAMAKQPERRWENLREFANSLQTANQGKLVPALDPRLFYSRFERAVKAIEQDNMSLASEILQELESEGYTNESIAALRRKVGEWQRQTAIEELLTSARRRLEECEYPLALEKVAGILALDADHSEALALRKTIVERQQEEMIAHWSRITARHLEAHAFSEAREAARHIVEAGDPEKQGQNLFAEIDRRESEYRQLAFERQELHNQVLRAWQCGNFGAALADLERLKDVEHHAGESGRTQHQPLYDQVRKDVETAEATYAACRKEIACGNFDAALVLCDQRVASVPANPLFRGLRIEVLEARRNHIVAEIDQLYLRVTEELDLDRKVELLEEAANRFPDEIRFRHWLETTRERRDLLRSLALAAGHDEEAGRFSEALGRWTLLERIYCQYPGLAVEIGRLKRLSEEQAHRPLPRNRAEAQLSIATRMEAAGAVPAARRLETAIPDPIPRGKSGGSRLETVSPATSGPSPPSPFEHIKAPVAQPEIQAQATSGFALNWLSRFRPQPPIQPPILLSVRRVAVITAAILLGVFLAGGAFMMQTRRRPHASGSASQTIFPLHVRSVPAAAEIRIDGKPGGVGDVLLTELGGEHRIEASLAGYRTERQTLRVGPGLQAAVNLTLEPKVGLIVSTDTADATITLDGGAPSKINNGQFELEDVESGKHVAVVTASGGEAQYTWERSQGAVAPATGGVVSEDLLGIFAKTTATEIILLSSKPGVKAAIGEGTPAVIEKDGLHLGGFAPGNYTVNLLDAADRTSFPLQVRTTPALTAFVHAEKEPGSIVLHTTEAGAAILVDGHKLVPVTNSGATRLPRVLPGKHTVSIAKEGFESPAPQEIEVFNRKPSELWFNLKRLPPPPSQFAIFGGPPNADVFLDQVRIGATQPDGSFLQDGILPGTHTIELRRQGYIPKSFSLRFDAGQKQEISGNLIAIAKEGKPASIRLSIAPPEAVVAYGRPNEPSIPVDPSRPVSVPKGDWVFTARAAGYEPLRMAVTVADGEAKELALKLVPIAVSKPDMLAGWQRRETWTAEGGSYVHQGGGFVLFDATPLRGSVTFAASMRKGKRLRWVLAFVDADNYIEFEVDGKFFIRYQVRNGKRTRLARIPLAVDVSKPASFEVLAGADSVRHLQSSDGSHWRQIDLWSVPGRNFGQGSFGFLLDEKDVLALSKFSYAP